MRKSDLPVLFLFTFIFVLVWSVWSFAQGLNRKIPVAREIARNHGTGSDGLQDFLTEIGTVITYTVILDADFFVISNNLTFTTNLTVRIMPGSGFDINAGSTVTVEGAWEAGPYLVFKGSGSATGSASFLFEYPEWGDTNQFNIGEGLLVSLVQITNNFAFWMTNPASGFEFLDTDNRDDITTNNIALEMTNAYPDLATNVNDLFSITNLAESYMRDAFPYYVDTNTVSVTNGEGYVNSNKFLITNSINVDLDMTAFNTSTGFVYIYIDDSSSTYPSGISLFDTTNEPTLQLDPFGWYAGTSQNDRVIGAVYITNGVLSQFDMTVDGSYYYYVLIQLGVAMNPDGLWQTPNTLDGSDACPVNTSELLLDVNSTDASANCKATATIADVVTNGQAIANTPQPWHATAFNRIEHKDWISLGQTRNILIRAEDDDDDGAFSANSTGYRLMR